MINLFKFASHEVEKVADETKLKKCHEKAFFLKIVHAP